MGSEEPLFVFFNPNINETKIADALAKFQAQKYSQILDRYGKLYPQFAEVG